jgi:hypothetical protein
MAFTTYMLAGSVYFQSEAFHSVECLVLSMLK